MGIVKDLITAGQDYFASREEEKAFQTLDIKADVPMHGTGVQGSSVPVYSSWGAWDNHINRMFGWNGSRINYAAEVGDLRLSVLLMAAVRWAGINLATGRLQVVELDGDDKEDPIVGHPLTQLLKRPNSETSAPTMWKQFAASWVLTGEVNFLIARDGSDRIKELWYEPRATIRPMWDRDAFPDDETANEFIRYYLITRNGREIPWRKRDVFRVCDHLDPESRRGTNGVDSLMRTIFTDQEREQYTALLLKNAGVTPIAVAPKERDARVDAVALAARLKRKTSSDERADPMAFDSPMEVLKFASDFSADAMEKVAHISESRVASALGISAQSLKFLVSQQSSTYNNVREFRREDYEQWIMPTHNDFLAAAENQLLRDMDDDPRHELRFDYSTVPIIQRDKMETAKETELLVKNRVIDQAEARERHGYDFDDPKYRDVWFPVQAATLTLSPIGGEPMPEEEDDTKAAKLPKVKEGELDDAAEFWSNHEALTEEQRELMGATPYLNGKAN